MRAHSKNGGVEMVVVIIAGGSGTRLWPLSTKEMPKHLLKLVGDRSMLQQTYDRARLAGDDVYVVTEASHSDLVKKQLPELSDEHFLIEPGRRGTANCFLLALDAISRKCGKDEKIAFVHSDHAIRDTEGFVETIKAASERNEETGAIALIGIVPTYAATGFGYIKKGRKDGSSFGVEAFREKPNYDIAHSYLESGDYLWNAGYFVGSVATFLREINQNAPAMEVGWKVLSNIKEFLSKDYQEAYLSLEDDAIDFALIERAEKLVVLPARFDWADVGNFRDLYEVLNDGKNEGNLLKGEDIFNVNGKNNFVLNNDERPVAVIGLDNLIVINTPNGLLISNKGEVQKVGDVAKVLNGR